jgi:predicted NAD-dependent protein-ADP-ribosyltransferase YbiA (DUF1768 family)
MMKRNDKGKGKGKAKEEIKDKIVPLGPLSAAPPIESYGLSIIRFSNKCKAVGLFKASGELLEASDKMSRYTILETLGNWRRVLSSFYETKVPILWNSKQYATQEHALNAAKFEEYNSEFAEEFSLHSIHGKDAQWARAAGSLKGKYIKSGKTIYSRPSEIKPDESYRNDDSKDAAEKFSKMLEKVIYSKYYNDAHARKVLLSTRYAILTESLGPGGVKIQVELMNVRERLREHEGTYGSFNLPQ